MLHARLNISHDMSALPDAVVALNASILVIDSLVSSLMIAMMSLSLRFMIASLVGQRCCCPNLASWIRSKQEQQQQTQRHRKRCRYRALRIR